MVNMDIVKWKRDIQSERKKYNRVREKCCEQNNTIWRAKLDYDKMGNQNF